MKKLLVVSLIFFFIGPAIASEKIDFNWDVYQELVTNKEIDQAAMCEALDSKIYGKPLFDYQVESLAKLVATGIANIGQMLDGACILCCEVFSLWKGRWVS